MFASTPILGMGFVGAKLREGKTTPVKPTKAKKQSKKKVIKQSLLLGNKALKTTPVLAVVERRHNGLRPRKK